MYPLDCLTSLVRSSVGANELELEAVFTAGVSGLDLSHVLCSDPVGIWPFVELHESSARFVSAAMAFVGQLVCGVVMALVLFTGLSVAATPDTSDIDFLPELTLREEFPASDFIFTFPTENQETAFGNLRNLFVNNDPILATLPNGGVAQNLVTLGPCAVNQPHTHPRGTEISHVTEGTLLFGFAEENGGRSFVGGNVTKSQTVIIPQGLIHFAQNLGCQEAQFIASFPNRDPGTQTTALSFFNLPLETIRATTGLSDSEIKKIIISVRANVNPSLDPECAKRCGIKY